MTESTQMEKKTVRQTEKESIRDENNKSLHQPDINSVLSGLGTFGQKQLHLH